MACRTMGGIQLTHADPGRVQQDADIVALLVGDGEIALFSALKSPTVTVYGLEPTVQHIRRLGVPPDMMPPGRAFPCLRRLAF